MIFLYARCHETVPVLPLSFLEKKYEGRFGGKRKNGGKIQLIKTG
jgi:hypothetical protein